MNASLEHFREYQSRYFINRKRAQTKANQYLHDASSLEEQRSPYHCDLPRAAHVISPGLYALPPHPFLFLAGALNRAN